jgi:hypothetical protein
MARRLRQVIDLYVRGRVAELKDGTPVWVQALNPFEQDTARNEAQIAKARLSMAVRELGSDEQAKVRMFFFEDGIEAAKYKIVDARVAEAMPKLLERLRNDPEWTERLQILDRGLADGAAPVEDIEAELLAKIASEYTAEINARLLSEREFLVDKYIHMEDEEVLWQDYLDWYIDRRAGELQLAEFRLHQIYFGTRWCNAIRETDGTWNHDECAGHEERLFVSKEETRQAPEELMELLLGATNDVEMTLREAKNSDRQGSSSDSSPLPSEAGESTASTPSETRVGPHGS